MRSDVTDDDKRRKEDGEKEKDSKRVLEYSERERHKS